MKIFVDDTAETRPKLAIIGAGFSGTAVAIHLFQNATGPLHLTIFNRSGAFSRGLAYGTSSPHHLLNVPAGNMSLFPTKPNDFLDFLDNCGHCYLANDFVPRSLYGDYLQTRLQENSIHASHCKFVQFSGEVRELKRISKDKIRLFLASGEIFDAAKVIIAMGNYSPSTPSVLCTVMDQRGYIADPWITGALEEIHPHATVFLLGAGLTMFDVVLELNRRGHKGPLVALSRRGLIPQSHRHSHAVDASQLSMAELSHATSLRDYLKYIRASIRQHVAANGDWRDVFTALRPLTPELWQRLSDADRSRFLRHLVPHWDTHRHRCAPQVGDLIAQLRDAGQLKILAGRIFGITPSDATFTISIRNRGSACTDIARASYIVNCTGPCNSIPLINDVLLQNLLIQGLAHTDLLGLGLVTDERYHMYGTAADALYYVGPLLKGKYWESTAVPELRRHAEQLARVVLHDLNYAKVPTECSD